MGDRGPGAGVVGELGAWRAVLALLAAAAFLGAAAVAATELASGADSNRLRVEKNGSGDVYDDGQRIDCGRQCEAEYSTTAGTPAPKVRLTAFPAKGVTFTGWQGDCQTQSDGSCVAVMDQDRDITANFSDGDPNPGPSPSASPSPSPSASASAEPSPSPSPSPQPCPSASPQPSPSASPSPSPNASAQPSPSPSAQPAPTPNPGACPGPTPPGYETSYSRLQDLSGQSGAVRFGVRPRQRISARLGCYVRIGKKVRRCIDQVKSLPAGRTYKFKLKWSSPNHRAIVKALRTRKTLKVTVEGRVTAPGSTSATIVKSFDLRL